MEGHYLGPATRARSQLVSSVVSFGASQPAAHVAAAVAVSPSLSAADPSADRHAQAQADDGEEEEGAVESGRWWMLVVRQRIVLV